MKHPVFIVAVGIALSSCAGRPTYVQPTAGQTAKLRIVTSADVKNVWVARYPGKAVEHKCAATPPEAIAILNNVSMLSSYADGGKNSNSVEVAIPADGSEFRFGVPLSYAVSASPTTITYERCIAHAGFIPRPGQTYVADHHLTSRTCGIRISRLADNGAKVAEPSSTYPECWDETLMPQGESFFKK